VAEAPDTRRAAILWFIASGLSLTAAILTYSGEGQIKWPLFAATVFMAILGFRTLKRARSDGA
jgi:hypothetical protein